MATPKTPFRSRRSMEDRRRSSSPATGIAPPLLGVVSRDSNDGSTGSSQGTPQPSPLAPPAPQPRPAGNEEEQSVADSLPSQVGDMMRPPSPYSPPPGSAWSETTEDQWPYNHTKRQFQKPTSGSSVKEGPRSTPSNHRRRRQQQQPHSVDRSQPSQSASTQRFSPTWEANPAATIAAYPQQQASVPPTSTSRSMPTWQRPSRLPPPSHRKFDNNTASLRHDDHYDAALFLLQEEHALLQAEYQQNQAHCGELSNRLEQQETFMEQLQAALRERNEQIVLVQEHLEEAKRQMEYRNDDNVQANDDVDDRIAAKDFELEQLKAEYNALENKYAAIEQENKDMEQNLGQQMTEKTTEYDRLQHDHERLQNEKSNVEAELAKAIKSSEELLDGKDDQVVELHEGNTRLKEELASAQEKLEKYETDIVRQSKRIFQLEEELERCRMQAEKYLKEVQQESLDRGNDWKVEKQRLQEEIRRLQEKLAEKDQQTATLLDEQRRQQSSQLRDLEEQVQYLTNSLAEYQGRHKELRTTVDEHLKTQAGIVPTRQNASCQTEPDECSTPAETPSQTEAVASGLSPLTPSVRFVDANDAISSRSARSSHISALRHDTPSPYSSTSPSVSIGVSPSSVSPWIPHWQGRPLHVRADPPPSLSPASEQSQSPPASFYPAVSQSDSSPCTAGSLLVVDEGIIEDKRVSHRLGSDGADSTARATNNDRLDTRRRNQPEQKARDISTLVEEKVRAAIGEQMTREYLESTIRDLRQKLERKESTSSQNWQKETNDLLQEIQRECNRAFERGKMRRTSPRSVFAHPFPNDNKPVDEDEMLHELLQGEEWEVSASENGFSLPLSPPHLDRSLEELAHAETMARGL